MCAPLHMPTNLAINDDLLNKALKAMGTIDYYEDYKPKPYRRN